MYCRALDHVVEAIRDRFDQKWKWETTCSVENEELVLKACAELDFVCEFYKDDLSKAQLQAQLPLVQPLCQSECSNEIITNHDVVRILGGLSSDARMACGPERSFTGDACYKCFIQTPFLCSKEDQDIPRYNHDPRIAQQHPASPWPQGQNRNSWLA